MEYTSVTSFCYEFNVPKVVINPTKGVTVDVEINASGIGEYRVPVRARFVQSSIADWVHGLDGFVFEDMGVEEVWFKLETWSFI
jgi:hypothetical protein